MKVTRLAALSWPKFLAHFGFWMAAVMLVVIGWTLYDASSDEMGSSQLISHTQDVLLGLAEINEALSRAEAAQRGFLVSGNEVFVAERAAAIDAARKMIERVRALTLDNPLQQNQVLQIEKQLTIPLAVMRENEAARRATLPEMPRTSVVPANGILASAALYALTAEMKKEELRLLALRRADSESRHALQNLILVAAVLIGVVMLIPGYLGFVLQVRSREQTERKLRAMADSLPGALYQWRQPLREIAGFTFISSALTRVCGLAPERRPQWEAIIAAIDARDRPGFLAAVEQAARTMTPFRHDYRVVHADGSSRWLHHEGSLQRDKDGSLLQNGYVADITEQNRLKHALQEAKEAADSANRAKSTFLATMSHEIRTPMNGMLGMLELLSLTSLEREQRTTLEIVRQSSKSLLRIVDDILDFSKIEAGKLEVRPVAASIRDVIENIHVVYASTASSKGLLIRRSIDPRIGAAVLVDTLRLRQILNNFVSNALKFTAQGTIEIRAELIDRTDAQERICFSVQDTGIGISAEDQQQLFEPFSQARGDTARHAGGTGLGLTICRRLAGMMGGTVEMVSEPGVGTTMILTLDLPVADPKDLPAAEAPMTRDMLSTTTRMRRMSPSVGDAETEGTLVLLVDDHPTNRLLLMRQVHALGYAAESAENGLEALRKWKSGRYGLVITDCNMPEMDGYALTRTIRELEAAAGGVRIPIIACTANAVAGEADICFASGMDDYLAKPVELKELLRKLTQWLPIPAAGAADPRPAADALADRSVLDQISGGDVEFARSILADFRRVNDEDAGMLKLAVAAGDIAQIKRTIHRIKGASRLVGALALAGVCESIEDAVRGNDLTMIEIGMGLFDLEWVRLNAHLDAL
jgi:signal transduction histidine kinase/CheY-like chemotaxis protein/HPt (histidine-containing phosphotransfer) domain-containing protein